MPKPVPNPYSTQQLRHSGNEARKARAEAGMSVVQVAEKAGCSRQVIYHLENAENWPSLPAYIGIIRALGLGAPPLT